MAGETSRFRFTTFDSSDDELDARGYKFSDADRIFIDRLLTQAVERHVHTGAAPAFEATDMASAPYLSTARTGGTIPANRGLYYRYTMVDSHGQEYITSQTGVAYTAPPALPPNPPTLSRTTGTLMAGDYVYAISAYTVTTDQETVISQTASILLADIGGLTLTFPTPPSGVTGFNIYRKGPMNASLCYLASATIAAGTYTDNGTVTANTLRGLPSANTTSTTNSIAVAPDTTTVGTLPGGASWKVFRTFSPDNWDDSLLAWTTTVPVLDTGHATEPGSPQTASGAVQAPPKINLGTDVTGLLALPAATVTRMANFTVEGLLVAAPGNIMWVNEYEDMQLLALRACLGRDSTPAAQDVLVSLQYQHPFTGWVAVPAAATYSTIPVGESSGTLQSLTSDTFYGPGARFRMVVAQAGGGATPTDRDLTVTVIMAVRDSSAPWPTGGL